MSGLDGSDTSRRREHGTDFIPSEALRFLVVDDVEPVARTLQEALTRLGHTALCAVSGEEALALMRTNRFDAVLSDLSMPDMSGWAVAEHLVEICNRRNIPKTPFILLTGRAREIENDRRLEECGVDVLLEKPVELKKLVRVVIKATRRTQ